MSSPTAKATAGIEFEPERIKIKLREIDLG